MASTATPVSAPQSPPITRAGNGSPRKDILEPHHLQEEEERMAYKRLMDHLEEKQHKQCKYLRRIVALLVFIGLTTALVCSLRVKPAEHWRLLKQRIWQWLTMTIMVTGVFSVVPFLTFLFAWPAKHYWKTSKYAVYFIRKMKRGVDVTIWACIVLTGWYLWFRRRLKHVAGDVSVVTVSQVTRFLIALCIGSLLWSIKNALQLMLIADLHYDQLFGRITQSIVYLNWVNILSLRQPGGRIPVEFLCYTNSNHCKFLKKPISWVKSKETADNSNHNCTNIWMDVKKITREKALICILYRLTEEYLKEMKLLIPENADQLLNHDEQLLEEANRMFELIVGPEPDRREISRDDLSHFGLSAKELDQIFSGETLGNTRIMKQKMGICFDCIQYSPGSSENEQSKPKPKEDKLIPIHKDVFISMMVRAHKNCWSLEHTLETSKRAFVKLDRILNSFLLVLMVIIWLLLSKIVTTAQLALLFTPFLAASFMFENSSMKMFHGIIFTFAMHPFDVGDRVIIENTQLRVKELNIMTSVLVKYDTRAEVIFPNSKLVNTKIVNLDITPDQSDTLEFIIKKDTPLDDIKDLELRIKKLLDDHPFYSSETKVVKNGYPETEELKMTLHLKYLVSYLPTHIKATRRSEILSMILKFRKEMEHNRKDYAHDQHHVIYHL